MTSTPAVLERGPTEKGLPVTDTVTTPLPSSVSFVGSGQTRVRDLRTVADFAGAIGVKPDTIHAYRSRGYLPEPIGTVGTTPVWSVAQLRTWLSSRPGQGRRRA